MTQKLPPLGRVLLYLAALESLRSNTQRIRSADFILSIGDIAPNEVRDDFAAMGIPFEDKTDLDVNLAYWALVKVRSVAEQDAVKAKEIDVHILRTEDIYRAIRQGPLGEAATNDSFPRSPQGAQLIDAAFDLALNNPELFLLGHGRMVEGQVAFRHQLEAARNALEEMAGVAIIADEVGLGKTIIAGLILEEVLAREPEATALILVPANLREQWVEDELPGFFDRRPVSDIKGLTYSQLADVKVMLLSLDQAKGTRKDSALSTLLISRTWDLLILDEAHECRNDESLRFKFVYSLKARKRIFLTATPIHNTGYDIFNLATLLKPGCLGHKRFFGETYMDGERVLKANDALQAAIRPMMTRTLRRKTGIRFAKRSLVSVRIDKFKKEESDLYDELLQLLRGVYQRHMGSAAEIARPSGRRQHVSQFVLISMLVLREMASHPLAAIGTLKAALRERVREFAATTHDDSDLRRLDAIIERYQRQTWDISHHAKSERLLEEASRLFASSRKFVIYVNYLETQKILTRLLKQQHPEMAVVSYEGGLGRDQKKAAIRAFRENKHACLVSTDCGGQGLNLQFADCILNYDFPWNPMRIEQRIGRVDRVKQVSGNVTVLNFCTIGTVEEYVQIVLTSKLKECQHVLGEFASPLQIEKVYEDKLTMGIGSALMNSHDADEMRKRMSSLGESELRRYVGDYLIYEKKAPPQWTWRPRG
jgi:SNF2 family DNA or RNA helicase